MTMDITKRKSGIKSEVGAETEDQIPKSTKRPFDVAFLMLPDERLKHRNNQKTTTEQHQQQPPFENNNDKPECNENAYDKPQPVSISPVDLHKLQGQKYFQSVPSKQQVFDDPTPFKIKPAAEAEIYKPKTLADVEQKSAFTKVNLVNRERRVSPTLSISPDINYQQSLSPSPPAMPPRNFQSFVPSSQVFRTQNVAPYQNGLMSSETFHHVGLENHFLQKSPASEILQPNFSKLRPMLGQCRPEMAYNYPQFPAHDMLKMGPSDLKFPPDIRNPAAAILTTLLPPSLAALSLPAQNVCAKCNVSFRMTSDLVYHMRSHHKNDSVDSTKRKREEKLKCPVCAESFRERHHLTRHMTAHQDKDEDEEPETKKKNGFANYSK